MNDTNADRTVTHLEESVTPPIPVTDDLRPLRERLAALMDRANHRIQLAGLEPDDCILERSARMRFAGADSELTIAVESLTDRDRLLKPFFDKYLQAFEAPDGDCSVEVTAVGVRAVRVPDFPAPATQSR